MFEIGRHSLMTNKQSFIDVRSLFKSPARLFLPPIKMRDVHREVGAPPPTPFAAPVTTLRMRNFKDTGVNEV
jgi:hypothetical protein